jgi:hypothetical protein
MLCRLLLGAGHQVAVAIQGDADVRVTHEGRERLCVDASSDHQAGEGMATLVGRDPLQPRPPPSGVGAVLQVLAVKGIRRRPPEEQVVSLAAGGELCSTRWSRSFAG